jgi:hypothetical protein
MAHRHGMFADPDAVIAGGAVTGQQLTNAATARCHPGDEGEAPAAREGSQGQGSALGPARREG